MDILKLYAQKDAQQSILQWPRPTLSSNPTMLLCLTNLCILRLLQFGSLAFILNCKSSIPRVLTPNPTVQCILYCISAIWAYLWQCRHGREQKLQYTYDFRSICSNFKRKCQMAETFPLTKGKYLNI